MILRRKSDGAQYIPGRIWVHDHEEVLTWEQYERWVSTPLPMGWGIVRKPTLCQDAGPAINRIRGAWPGDEPIDEILKALKDD